MTKTCPCGNEFTPSNDRAQYCGHCPEEFIAGIQAGIEAAIERHRRSKLEYAWNLRTRAFNARKQNYDW